MQARLHDTVKDIVDLNAEIATNTAQITDLQTLVQSNESEAAKRLEAAMEKGDRWRGLYDRMDAKATGLQATLHYVLQVQTQLRHSLNKSESAWAERSRVAEEKKTLEAALEKITATNADLQRLVKENRNLQCSLNKATATNTRLEAVVRENSTLKASIDRMNKAGASAFALSQSEVAAIIINSSPDIKARVSPEIVRQNDQEIRRLVNVLQVRVLEDLLSQRSEGDASTKRD